MPLIVLIADDDQDDDESIVKRPHAPSHDMAGDETIEHFELTSYNSSCAEIPPNTLWE